MRRVFLAIATVCLLAFSAFPVLAQQGEEAGSAGDQQIVQEDNSESRASQERTIPGGTLAIASYIILWLMTLGFVGVTAKRQSALADELETLEGRMDSVLGELEDEG